MPFSVVFDGHRLVTKRYRDSYLPLMNLDWFRLTRLGKPSILTVETVELFSKKTIPRAASDYEIFEDTKG